MTIEEAIQGLLNVKVQMAEESPFTKAVDLSIEALEKQIPQKPIFQDSPITGVPEWVCGNCKILSLGYHASYCARCGQHIDWS